MGRDGNVRREGLVRSVERRRYVFQVWTNAAFAAVWLLLFVLSDWWVFLALTVVGFVLCAMAGGAVIVLRRRDERGRAGATERAP